MNKPYFMELYDYNFWTHRKVWEAIMQVFNPSTDHRAQTLAGLHQLGALTVGQDILDYLFEKQEQ